MSFTEFPKIARFDRTVVITEKIDGTNAQIEICDPSKEAGLDLVRNAEFVLATHPETGYVMLAGSRSRYITPDRDNFGFARWVQEHSEMLFRLGPGRHYGEWWGNGIQRGYGLPQGDKRFSLFNVHRYKDGVPEGVPCSVVPVLLQHTGLGAVREHLSTVIERLKSLGSVAAPGFMNPEGVVLFHTASSTLYKYTLDGDGHKEAR